ncbi:MAG: methyltransferase domain-containing protein [Pirellulales bacterium]|nr:methyltransferase domain-containing protein [Pirellulales bacterium]
MRSIVTSARSLLFAPFRGVRAFAAGLARKNREWGPRIFAWWWWRSANRPHVLDRTYQEMLDELPDDAIGLDLGSGNSRIRPGAVTVDTEAYPEVDHVCDATKLPFPDEHFDYVWSNAVLEHVRYPWKVAAEITRVLKPGGLAIIQTPFFENVHGWPEDYFRYTPNGLRVLFEDLDDVASGVSAGPGQVLPDIVQFYMTGLTDLQQRGALLNLWAVFVGFWLLPIRYLDRLICKRPFFWKLARAYYFVGRKPV